MSFGTAAACGVSLLKTGHHSIKCKASLLAQVLLSGPALPFLLGTAFLGPSMHWLEEGPGTPGIFAYITPWVLWRVTTYIFRVVLTTGVVDSAF